jgi:hypothetical protein
MSIKIHDYSDNNEEAIAKLETCQYRSELIEKTACCSSSKIIGFRCNKKDIFPVSFSVDCKNCTDYIK